MIWNKKKSYYVVSEWFNMSVKQELISKGFIR